MDSSSPEPKGGTLTPPGSSPLGVECAHIPQFTQNSAPPSPVTPMTPDSAHMTVEPLPANQSESFGSESTNHKPLIGAQKRKAAKVHKCEPECASRPADVDSHPSSRLTCSVCQAVMGSQHDFTRHIRTHNRVIEDDSSGAKLFECGLCKKQLSSNSSLDRHMLVHSGERPFRCHICGTHFTTNGNMHRHIRGHFRNGGAGGGSDTGDSDGGSEGSAVHSPRKRSCAEFEDEGPAGKIARLHNESYSADDEVSLNGEEEGCPVCGAELDGVSALKIHLKEEHPNRNLTHRSSSPHRPSSPRTEPPSDLSSVKGSPFSTHERGERSLEGFMGGGVHHCPTCGLPFPSVESWLLHLRDHPTLKCNLCDATFDSISDYTTHQQRHSQEVSGRLPLFEQGHTPPSGSPIFPRGLPFPVTSHQQQISFAGHESLKRGLLSSSSQLPLLRHPPISLHSPSPLSIPQPHPHDPSSGLSHDEQFARDYRDMKLNGQYPCRLCKEVFANLRKLKSHNLVHMIAPPYQCNLCSFVSNDKNTLKEHMKNHKGDTPYECNLCSLSFTTKANCERHIKNIHGRQTRDEVKRCMTYTPLEDGPPTQEPSRDTICRLCNFDCKSRSVLRDHMRSLHPEGVDKPYSCKICHVSFQSSSEAFRHIIQAHQDAVSRESLETLVEQRSQRDETQPDLSSVESLLTISNLPLPITSSSSSSNHVPRQSAAAVSPAQSSIVPGVGLTLNRIHTAFPPPKTIVSPSLPIAAFTPPSATSCCEDAPLDLSMNKRPRDEDDGKEDRKERRHHDASDDEEITVIDEDDKSKKSASKDGKVSDADVVEIKATSGSPQPPDRSTSSESKAAFPLMYPGQLPVQLLPFHGQYPFLMNPFGALPPVPNLQILEQYQELKRGLQLTSGGTLLNADSASSLIPSVRNSLLNASNNRFMKTSSSSFQLSAMLAASQSDHTGVDDGNSLEGRSQTMATDLSPSGRENEEISRFTMKNSVLVKKPKQRRYRTERPWRCDLCDKGFTLRSNMERHMKQQHPDLWQQRPRGATSSHRIGPNPTVPRELFGQTTIELPKLGLKSDPEEATSENTDGGKEDDESELIIDDEEEEEEEGMEDSNKEEITRRKREENAADLASVQKLLSTASAQNFSFFHKEAEEGDRNEDHHSSPSLSPASQQDTSSEEGKKSAYSSAPQKQKCPFCYRKFPWSSSLVRHIRTHTGQKPYLCPVCHFPFTTKSNCDRHLQRKHPDSSHALSGDRPFRCSKCPGAAFTSVESRRKHDMFKHERSHDTSLIREDLKVYGTKVFWCYLCNARCYSSKEMLQHVAESHPDNFRSLRLQDRSGSSTSSSNLPSSPARENNNETSSDSASEAAPSGSDMVICMLCYQKTSNVEELKEHILSRHTYTSSDPPFSPDSCLLTEEERREERQEADEGEEEEEEEEEHQQGEEEEEEEEEEGDGEDNIPDQKEQKETSDFISNMLGTKPAVIDRLLSSKATSADAAKLLGVR